jgi:hypothetical protein
MNGSLQLMTIEAFTDKDFQVPLENGCYTVMINPESMKWERSIEYNEEQAPDTNTPSQKYKYTPGDQLNFDIVIDCTGIIDSARTDMPAEIDALKYIMFTYNGDIHRPNFVKIQWGANFVFSGVLTNFDISYTFFRPDGTPLRCKVSLAFKQYISPEVAERLKNKKSPDVSHVVTVEEGMTLPQLCVKVWNDDAYYVQVARYNNLNKFRNLKGIRQLIFPPIIPIS